MASATAQRTVQLVDTLIRLVIRAFYGPDHVVVADALVREKRYMKDEDLAIKLKIHYKQVRKALTQLKVDRLIKSEVRQEAGTVGADASAPIYRKTTYEFFYIDYKTFVDVVKWKINAMNKMLDKDTRPGYRCPRCGATYTDLQMNELINFRTGKCECTKCKTEVEAAAPTDGGGGPHSQSAFNKQLRLIKEKLRETEDLEIPFFDRGPMNITTELTRQMARKGPPTSGVQPAAERSGGKRGAREYDFTPTLDVEIVTAETDSAAYQNGPPKVPRLEDKGKAKAPVPWMQGAADAAAAAEKKAERDAAEKQAQTAAGPSSVEWNKRFFDELSRQDKAHQEEAKKQSAAEVAAAQAAALEQTPGDGQAEGAEAEEEEEETVAVGGEKPGEAVEHVPLSAVTQEHIDKMTPAQYQLYAAAMKKRVDEYNASVMQQ